MAEPQAGPQMDVGMGSTVSLEALLTASPYLFCALDGHGTIRRVNAAAEAVFGYSEDELMGRSLLTLLPPEDRPGASKAMSDAGEVAEGPLTLRAESSAGHLRKLSVWVTRDPVSDLIISWGNDVTESRAIRDELKMRIELLEDRLAERTRSMAELQTRLENLRRNPMGELPRGESRRASRPASPLISGSVRSRWTPSSFWTPPSLRRGRASRLRSGSPPRMTMGRSDPIRSSLPDSSSDPEPRPETRPPMSDFAP